MATSPEVQLLYIAYLGRPADPSGLSYWLASPRSGLSQESLASFFSRSAEYQTLNSGATTAQIIQSIYRNLFGRSADAGGLQFWSEKVSSGGVSTEQLGLAIARGALAQTSSAPDRLAIESKLSASSAWTAALGSDPQRASLYAGPAGNAFGSDFLAGINSPATVPSPAALQAALGALPPNTTIGLLSTDLSQVREGGFVTFTIQAFPGQENKQLSYTLTGISSNDIVGGALAGTVQIGADRRGTIRIQLATDEIFEASENLTIAIPGVAPRLGSSTTLPIIDGTAASIEVQANAPFVNEGGILTFNIDTQNIAPGTLLNYNLSGAGITSADVGNVPLNGTVAVGANGSAQVSFNVSADLATEGTEAARLTVSGGGSAPVRIFGFETLSSRNPNFDRSSFTYPTGPFSGQVNPNTGDVRLDGVIINGVNYSQAQLQLASSARIVTDTAVDPTRGGGNLTTGYGIGSDADTLVGQGIGTTTPTANDIRNAHANFNLTSIVPIRENVGTASYELSFANPADTLLIWERGNSGDVLVEAIDGSGAVVGTILVRDGENDGGAANDFNRTGIIVTTFVNPTFLNQGQELASVGLRFNQAVSTFRFTALQEAVGPGAVRYNGPDLKVIALNSSSAVASINDTSAGASSQELQASNIIETAAAIQIPVDADLLTGLGGQLTPVVTNARLTLGGVADTSGPAQGLLSARNILALTGVEGSLTEDQLLDRDAVAANINRFGVSGNGLAPGATSGNLEVTTATRQALIVQQGATSTALYLYNESSFDFSATGDYTVEAAELQQIGLIENNLLTGSELFA